MNEIVIEADHINSTFRLVNCTMVIASNKRLGVSLKRLNYVIDGMDIIVPFEEETKILILDGIQQLLGKFGLSQRLSKDAIRDIENYEREVSLFNEFAENAKRIRNNEFSANPELVDDFELFQTVIKRNFVRPLYPLQLLSSFHMAFSQNACNFAVPGAGKTSIVLGAYYFLRQLPFSDPRHVDKLLVVGPLSSFAPWENEYFECFGKKPTCQRLSGDINISREKKEEHLYSGNPAELTLIYHGGLDSLQKEIIDFLKINKTMVVIDEAHRIKNPDGVWGRSAVQISKEARARVILTGTPVPNGYEDLYNLFQFIYPFKFKHILHFHYANLVDMTNNDQPDSERVIEFTANISPFFIRIKKSDLKLPPKYDHIVEIEMSSYQREIYEYVEATYLKSFSENGNGSVKDVLNRAKMIRLRQASTNPALLAKPLKDSLENNQEMGEVDPNSRFTQYVDEFIDDSELFYKICNYSKNEVPAKFVEVKRILTEKILGKGQKLIIWTIFIKNAKDLHDYLLEHTIQSRFLIGETPQLEREDTISKFNDPSNLDFQVVIANPFSVAESISLHKGCHNAIYLERDYNCSNFLQSKDRIHRVGLAEGQITTYYYIVSKNSIDGVIDERLKIKIKRMEAIIDKDIPLFSRINDEDETDLINALMIDYAKRT